MESRLVEALGDWEAPRSTAPNRVPAIAGDDNGDDPCNPPVQTGSSRAPESASASPDL